MIAEIETGKLDGNPVIGLPVEDLPTSVNGWFLRPFQIVSLLMVLEQYGQGFFRMGEVMQRISMAGELGAMSPDLSNANMPAVNITGIEKELDNLKSWCAIVNLHLSIKSIDWAKKEIRGEPQFKVVGRVISEVQRRVYDELDSVWFLDIPPDRLHYYDNADLFGEEAKNKISGIDTDIAEAGSCFATGRYTACVFHLMRIMERGTQELGNRLGIQLTGEKNWQVILDQVNNRVRGMNPQTPKDKENRDNFSAATAHLHNVKEAWRNRVMHPKQTYTDEEAKAIMDNVRTFVVHLARNVL